MYDRTVYVLMSDDEDLLNMCVYAGDKKPDIVYQFCDIEHPSLIKCVFTCMDKFEADCLDRAVLYRDYDWILANCEDDSVCY